MKNFLCSIFTLLTLCCFFNARSQTEDKAQIDAVLNQWHQAAAQGNAQNYFGAMSDDAIFIGTDASENWNKKAFEAFAKPYFNKGKAWDFKPIERHVYFSADHQTAWFDELLDTWMKVCRGSGVLVKLGKEWKIQHYVLSMTIPNDNTNAVIKIKAPIEEALIQKLKKEK
ncbi:nuclear transport factor 2 family protein [Flavobacterium sp. CYK-4]|uniref:nuclear transport factor 2 family protein n=1 Tax=Flavobacterium lotistagni TaxID=2709660 RepID=UPI00140D846B|nr:nuclear transport factor 2 family protein [Flavobacterium lotistagni]NHM07813.1 nuclear transport factor 2 family protein [Flavobacterium lotistagni]